MQVEQSETLVPELPEKRKVGRPAGSKSARVREDRGLQLPNLRYLDYSPEVNPLCEPSAIQIRKKWVRAGGVKDLVDPDTGRPEAVSVIHKIKDLDPEEFVKVFAAGVRAMYELTLGASRVFQIVLDAYNREPMHGGFADSVYFSWVNGGLLGRDVGMTEGNFNKGLRELIAMKFLAPRAPGLYWVNINLFFKGDRVMFVNEYRRKKLSADEVLRANLEKAGQQRLAA